MLKFLFLCFSAVAVSCAEYGWQSGKIYKYDLNWCLSSPLYFTAENGTIYGAADLYIQPITSDALSVRMQNQRRAEFIKGELNNCLGRKTDLEFKDSSKEDLLFEINLRKGSVISRIINPKNEDKQVFSFIESLLQLDLLCENCENPNVCRPPTDEKPNTVYKTVEPYFNNMCETQYEVSPFPDLQSKLNLAKMPDLPESGFEVIKTVINCDGKVLRNSDDVSASHTFRTIISGKVENYVVVSSSQTHSTWWTAHPDRKTTNLWNITLNSIDTAKGNLSRVSDPVELKRAGPKGTCSSSSNTTH